MRLPLAALLLLAAGHPLQGAAPVNLAVTVEGVANGSGHVLIAVCTPKTFLGADCPYTSRVPAVAGAAKLLVRGIEPGVYAVQAFHDENDNFDLDQNFLGLPQEGMGFSNDAPMRFGPPTFEDAAIEIGPDHAATSFRMRYFGSG